MCFCHWCCLTPWPEQNDGDGMYHCGCGNRWYWTRLRSYETVNFEKLADKCQELGHVGSILLGWEAFPKFNVDLANPYIDVTRYLRAAPRAQNCQATIKHQLYPWDLFINTKPDGDPPLVGRLYRVWNRVRRVTRFDSVEVELEESPPDGVPLVLDRKAFDDDAYLVVSRYDRLR